MRSIAWRHRPRGLPAVAELVAAERDHVDPARIDSGRRLVRQAEGREIDQRTAAQILDERYLAARQVDELGERRLLGSRRFDSCSDACAGSDRSATDRRGIIRGAGAVRGADLAQDRAADGEDLEPKEPPISISSPRETMTSRRCARSAPRQDRCSYC
jgi:hypothetical protein